MGAYAALAVLVLAGVTFIQTPAAWLYIAAVAAGEAWLYFRFKKEGGAPAAVGRAPYHFTREEAELIGRYRLYFTFPQIAHQASSALAAVGLTTLVLVPWLIFRGRFPEAVLIGMNLFAVARFTKALSPQLALRVRAHKGDREALRMLELHDPLWQKINNVNAAER
ncbi:MAG: hypothetical protein ACT4P4_12685 [Betaproteobacteria bacterium]